MSRTPDLPGQLVPIRSSQEHWLKRHVAALCNLDNERFPGSQPVSFGTRDLLKLESQDFWVCEKSDGVRVLLLVAIVDREQLVYIIDRRNTYRAIQGIFFPHFDNPVFPLQNTIVDGELVIDTDPATGKETLRFLAFDCLVVDNHNVMSRPLDKRYGRLNEWFFKPYAKMIRDHPEVTGSHPFKIAVKQINFSYHVEKVFSEDIPKLQHGNDGLIYTCVNTPYTPGTDINILKWKPPFENSIDFKLVLKFPPSATNPKTPDFYAKPIFLLYVWTGDERGQSKYEEYDQMYVDDDEWEKLKLSGEQLDDRIVEVHWDPTVESWRMMRFREDKPNGNHRSVVDNIIQSIADGVEKEALLARSNEIRNAWKVRHGQPSQPQPQQPQAQQRHQSQGPPPPPAANMRPPPVPLAQFRYGPISTSPWSKVSGPAVIAGMKR
ncbi:mRNA capping enzyme [Cyathus striatus]|nr:mRNA capping enzyme [Cyathus striatus]